MAAKAIFTSQLTSALIIFVAPITYVINQSQCTNVNLTANESAQYITSPDYPNNYPSGDCQWYMRTNISLHVIALTIADFYTDDVYPICSNSGDVLIYDGDSILSPVIGILCGHPPNETFISTGPSMTIIFYNSYAHGNNTRFKFEYTSEDRSVLCTDNNLLANETGKYLYSPGYPSYYPSNFDCQWHITASQSSNLVVLALMNFRMGGTPPSCLDEYLAIYDGNSTESPTLEILCGQLPGKQFKSTGSSMTLVFHSSSSSKNSLFEMEYLSPDKQAPCKGVTLVASENEKSLSSPYYPYSFPGNIDCQWHISTDSNSSVVSLMFSFIKLFEYIPHCIGNRVSIYDGPSTSSQLIAILCQEQYNKTINSTGSDLTIVFSSDGIFENEGFNLTYFSKMK